MSDLSVSSPTTEPEFYRNVTGKGARMCGPASGAATRRLHNSLLQRKLAIPGSFLTLAAVPGWTPVAFGPRLAAGPRTGIPRAGRIIPTRRRGHRGVRTGHGRGGAL